jgi:hypothetical protein
MANKIDKAKLQRAFDAMLKGKSFRITKECKTEWENCAGHISDTWFQIQSIDCFGCVTISGNNHSVMENEDINSLVNL